MLTCKISARFHSLTEMSPDRNGSDRNVPWPKGPRPKRLRPNRPDRVGQTEKSRTLKSQPFTVGVGLAPGCVLLPLL